MVRRLAELQGREPQTALEEMLAELDEKERERIAAIQASLDAEDEAASAESEDPEAEPSQDANATDDSAESEETSEKPKRKRRGHGPRDQPDLPRAETLYELDSAQCEGGCPCCGGDLEPLGEQSEDYEEIDVIERQYQVRKVRRRKYRCRCNGAVVTAPGPSRVVPGGRYSTDFIVQSAVEKYAHHIPLTRQVSMMKDLGLEVTVQTLFDQLAAASDWLVPVYDELGRRLLESPVIHVDETGWRDLGKQKHLAKKKKRRFTMWVRTTSEIAHFSLPRSKSLEVAKELFASYEGILVADGYQVYESLVRGARSREGPELKLANCWAHARRHFEKLSGFPRESRQMIAWIKDLYEVEREVGGPFPGDAEARARRHALRKEKSVPILATMREWLLGVGAPPRSGMGKAVRYVLERWDGLTLFLEDPRVPLDNNAAERALRGPVVGRKVHYGSKSERGAKVAAVFYTLCETAKLHGLAPSRYLRATLDAAMETPGRVLLPQDYRPPDRETDRDA